MDSDQIAQLVYLVLLLVAVGGWVLVEYRTRLGVALRTAMAWGMIFLGVMAGYGLWTDIKTDIAPRQMVAGGQIEVPRAQDGHYYLTLEINAEPIRFMADTGASNMVLSDADAARLGIDPASLAYMGEASTANGVVRTANVTLPVVELGPYRDEDFRAYVTEGDMDISLLGMDYLGQYRIEIADGTMILRR
jgi:aspartyl protease family protein